jgi:hypothetical protein
VYYMSRVLGEEGDFQGKRKSSALLLTVDRKILLIWVCYLLTGEWVVLLLMSFKKSFCSSLIFLLS